MASNVDKNGAPKQDSENVGKLEENALKRKERLRQLREHKKSRISSDESKAKPDAPVPKPFFRTYTPNDESLKDLRIPDAEPERIDDKVREALDEDVSEDLLDKDIDIATLAPRKPDWDLKRDIVEKLERLERKTKRAVAELIRERLRENKADLARVVQNARPEAEDDD